VAEPKIPDWLTKLAGTTKHLPLETRQKMLPGIVKQLHKTGMLSKLTGENLSQSAVYMTQFLGGSGEPLELEISDKEWKALIKKADETEIRAGSGIRLKTFNPQRTMFPEKIGRNIPNPWKSSTNPEYHGDQGWEWKQIEISKVNEFHWSKPLYNIIGHVTTLRRRKIDDNKYEYQIAEDFDVIEGAKGIGRGGTDYSKRKPTRRIPHGVAKIIEAVFPEYTESTGDRYGGEITTTGALQGVPVPIKSSYIHSTKTEDMLMNSMTEEEGIF
jgi:hypothetical protein